MAAYDLTHAMAPFLDTHLALTLLDFLQQRQIYVEADVLKSKLELLSKTGMADLEKDAYEELNPGKAVPAEMNQRREGILKRYEEINAALGPVIELFENEEVLAEISKNSNRPEALRASIEPFGFKPEMIDTLETCAKFYYQIGNYEEAAQFLYNFRVLSSDADKNLSALWGKLAAEILSSRWSEAQEDLTLLMEYIDAAGNREDFKPLQQLQQRAWLLHWSLFVFFNRGDEGLEELITLFHSKPDYSNAIQTVCPHLLRYLTAVVITNQRNQYRTLSQLKEILKQEKVHYSDPITEFFISLYDEFDFEKAQAKLKECEAVLANDMFLAPSSEDFLRCARLFVFEIYCKVHSTISIPMLAEKLDMTQDKAEEWIVNLIRNANMDARIDSEAGHVIMSSHVPSIYQQVLDKTKGISYRSRNITNQLDKAGRARRGGGGGGGGGGTR